MTDASTTQPDSSTRYTPAPLTVKGPSPGLDRGTDDGGDYAIVDAENHIIGEAFHLVARGGVTKPAKANATLWAAAPELLNALDSIRVIAEGEPTIDATLVIIQRMARAAIQAAKGPS